MKRYSQDELFEQIKLFLSDNMKDGRFIIDDISLECKCNWIGENDNNRYKILASRDYEFTLKIKAQ